MTDELQVFDRSTPDTDLGPWQTWLRRHGINPNDVVMYSSGTRGYIYRMESSYQVIYLGIRRDDSGRILTPPTERRVVQLEGKPLPFPPPPKRNHVT